MSDAYPDDVIKSAHATVLAANEECANERFILGTGNALDVLDRHVARAILAERERITPDYIAAIIRKVDGSNSLGAGALGEAIAAAIRKGEAS